MEGHQHAVLLVEDHDDSREVLAATLDAEGCHVVAAADGEEALTRLRAGVPPCVILLDLHLAGMSAAAFRDAQLADPRLADVPLVLLSADATLAERAAELGVADYVKKPATAEQLMAAVRAHCLARPAWRA